MSVVKKYWKKMLLAALLLAMAVVLAGVAREFITFDAVKRHSSELQKIVQDNYVLSVGIFSLAVFTTAFFIPGALIMTVAGGFLFGAIPGAFYAATSLTAGSVLAFLLSRHLIGAWVQQRYRRQLERFNSEIARHGPNYLFVLRIVPVMPAFLLNYLSGMTRISAGRFALFSFLGISPGAVVYSLAGLQLQSIQAPGDLLSARILAGIWMLAIFSLSPVIFDLVRWYIRTRNLRKKRTGG